MRGSRKEMIWKGIAGLLAGLLVVLGVVSLYRVRQLESRLEAQKSSIAETQSNRHAGLRRPMRQETKPDQSAGVMPAAPREGARQPGTPFRRHPMPEAPPSEIPPEASSPPKAAVPVPESSEGQTPKDRTEAGAAGGIQVSEQNSEALESPDALTEELTRVPPLVAHPASPEATRNRTAAKAEATEVRRQDVISPEATAGQAKSKNQPPLPRKTPAGGQPPEEDPQAQAAFWLYEAHDSDTFWNIAKVFYGSGHYYPVLLEHNPEIGLFSVGEGVRLKILKDVNRAKGILRKIVKREGNRLIWHYTVMAGDTQESIAGKYYKTDDKVARLLELNPGVRLQPGERLRIQLE